MSAYWLRNDAPAHVTSVEIVFPVRGHTFLPCDRVFGIIEKKLRKKERLYSPKEYHDVFAESGNVKLAGDDWDVLAFKEAAEYCLKSQMPVKIQENKRFFIKRGHQHFPIVKGEQNFRFMQNDFEIITKKGKHFNKAPAPLQPGVPLKEAKVKDIHNLLCVHSGDNWKDDERYAFIKSVLDGETTNTDDDVDDNELCNCLDEDPYHPHI